MELKYVMFAFTFGNVQRLFPVFFPEQLIHSEVADAVRHMKMGSKDRWVRPVPVSAGMVSTIHSGAWECYGESESLKLKSHPEDSQIIQMFPYLHGIGYEPRDEDG